MVDHKTMADDKLSEEIIELQSKLQFQEDTIQHLDDEVIRQTKLIDKLVLRLEQLESRVKDLAANSQTDKAAEQERPPHY